MSNYVSAEMKLHEIADALYRFSTLISDGRPEQPIISIEVDRQTESYLHGLSNMSAPQPDIYRHPENNQLTFSGIILKAGYR